MRGKLCRLPFCCNLFNYSYNPKHDQSQRRHRFSSLTSRKSNSRKQFAKNAETQSFSSSPAPTTSSARMQSQSLKADSRRDTTHGSLKKKKKDIANILSPKSEPRSEKKPTSCLQSVPEPEEVHNSPAFSQLESESDKTTETKPRSSVEYAINEGETKREESQERKELNKSGRSFTRSSLLIQAMGPNRSLLIQRTPAQGPNPAFHRGRDLTLAKGHNPSILLKNQCNLLHAT
ncbi:hypothetical protein Aperf_G00000031459 [Anoplocephala perfoliata]